MTLVLNCVGLLSHKLETIWLWLFFNFSMPAIIQVRENLDVGGVKLSSPDITQARENLDVCCRHVFSICFYLLFITKLFGLNDDLVRCDKRSICRCFGQSLSAKL